MSSPDKSNMIKTYFERRVLVLQTERSVYKETIKAFGYEYEKGRA